MKVNDIYRFFIKEGIAADLREKKDIQNKLNRVKKNYAENSPLYKKFFDKEECVNPYCDTRILYLSNDREVRKILVGIDIGVGEVIMANMLSANCNRIDLIVAHHPEGAAWAGLSEVMDLQTDLLTSIGIDKNIAQSFMSKRIEEVSRKVHGSNHSRAIDAARLLDIPFLSCHTPADNHVARYLQELMDKKRPKKIKDLIALLLQEPEYAKSFKDKSGPKIIVGDVNNNAGRIFVDMTGGTGGSEEIYGRLSQIGIDTIVCMHMADSHYKRIKNEFINVVVAGHMASDSLGMNLLLDKLIKKNKIDIVSCSGFIRASRL